jgi:ABC-type polysaccharide/polyol phosphate transport system ATPase subunit
METENLIKFSNVSKFYYKNFRKSQLDSFLDYYNPFFSNMTLRKGQFECIKNISFQVKRGETLGIIGENGSGKSTILKLILGNIKCNKGYIYTSGNVVPLINLGFSLFPMLNIIENIRYNLNLLNYDKNQIDEKIQKILNFSEIPKHYFSQIIRNYSTGMKMRLAFSIAIFSDPDILLVDEVFSVGDFNFTKKVRRHISEIKKKIAMVIVSHNSHIINDYADNCIVLTNGVGKFFNKSIDGIKFYENSYNKKKVLEKIKKPLKKINQFDDIKIFLDNKNKIQKQNILINLNIFSKTKIEIKNIRFYIKDYSGLLLFRNSIPNKKKENIILSKGNNRLIFKISNCSLASGSYTCHIAVKKDSIQILSHLDFDFKFININEKKNLEKGNSILFQNFIWRLLKKND